MLMNRLSKKFDVELGNQRDICFYCLQEYHKSHQDMDPVAMRKELAGQLLNQEVYKNRKIGRDFVICKKHLGEIAKILGYDIKEEDDNKEIEARSGEEVKNEE